MATLKILLDHHVSVRMASSSRHALESMAEVQPSLIVIDASMPQSHWRPMLRALPPRLRASPITLAVHLTAGSGPPSADAVAGDVSIVTYHHVHELVDHLATAASSRPVRPSLAYSPHVLDALDFIARRYARTMSLRTLAAAVGISVRHLVHVFRADMDRSVMEYLKILRIEVVKCLLWDGMPRLEDLAERVGFSDSSHLSRVFLEQVGVRPGQYYRMVVSRLGAGGTLAQGRAV